MESNPALQTVCVIIFGLEGGKFDLYIHLGVCFLRDCHLSVGVHTAEDGTYRS